MSILDYMIKLSLTVLEKQNTRIETIAKFFQILNKKQRWVSSATTNKT